MQNIVILAGNIGQTPKSAPPRRHQDHQLQPRHVPPRLSEGRVLRDENGYRSWTPNGTAITCFNGLGKTVAEHCEKGMKVLVHGRIHTPSGSTHGERPLRLRGSSPRRSTS